MKRTILAFALVLGLLTPAIPSFAHCQIPCGIYDDELRVQLIEEHIGTVEKSMKKIVELGSQKTVDYNQLVRWVDNKETHAQEIQDIVTEYFMAQRIKPSTSPGDGKTTKDYFNKLSLLHAIQVHAMKAKQGTDLSEIEKLRELTAQFRTAYFGADEAHTH